MGLSKFIASGLLFAAAAASAAPGATLTIVGDTFNQAFRLTNSSTSAFEQITSFRLDLSSITTGTFCFDPEGGNDVCNGAINNGRSFTTLGAGATQTGLRPVDVADGASLLELAFGLVPNDLSIIDNFDRNESLDFLIDIDGIGGVQSEVVFGNQLIGASVTIGFYNTQTRQTSELTGVLGQYVLDGAVVAQGARYSNLGDGGTLPPGNVPEPGTLALLGAAALALGLRRRRG